MLRWNCDVLKIQNFLSKIPVHFSVKEHTHGDEIVDQMLCFFVQGRAKTNMVASKFNSSGSIVWFEKENSRKITITCFLPRWQIFTIRKKKTEKLLRFYSSRSAGYQTKPVFLYKAWKQNDKAMIIKLTKWQQNSWVNWYLQSNHFAYRQCFCLICTVLVETLL